LKNGYFGATIFKILFTAKIKFIFMIKKMPLTFLDVKKYFMFVLLRPRRNDREQFQRKEGHSVDFHTILK
jgi:hypothetical protein